MTTPGGVPNLPAGALTPETMASRLQDMSTGAVRSRAAARMPASFHSSNGGDPGADLTPFGVITRIFAGFISAVANADPGDIDGPEDLPGLLLDFIEQLPVIGQFVALLEAINGQYDGADEVLLAIQDINAPMRKLLQLFTGHDVGWPTPDDVGNGWIHLHDAVQNNIQGIVDRIYNAFANLGDMLDVNNPLNYVIDAILGIFDTARAGSAKALALEARVRALESAGNTITLTFNGTAQTPLPPAQYDIRRMGGGAGDIGTDGKGNMVWKPFGAGNRIVLARYKLSELATDNGHIQAMLSTTPQPYIFDDAYTYLTFRENEDLDTMVRLRIGYDSIRLQAMVDDVITNIGPAADVNPKAGNAFDIWFGNDDDGPRAFTVALLGETIIDVVDTDEVSTVGSDFRGIGVGMETGNYLVFGQNRPAGLGVVTATEVL